ncbi:hypothetical protein F5884DRAFT_456439 [Xylogone sp. PMI_703]|nr:hypothetical protein F5884DRAFT_456439 [Xylogone sp. PMI_703]
MLKGQGLARIMPHCRFVTPYCSLPTTVLPAKHYGSIASASLLYCFFKTLPVLCVVLLTRSRWLVFTLFTGRTIDACISYACRRTFMFERKMKPTCVYYCIAGILSKCPAGCAVACPMIQAHLLRAVQSEAIQNMHF